MNRPTSLLLAAWLALASFTGCSGVLLSDRPATRTWWLEPLAPGSDAPLETLRPVALHLEVVPGLDSDRVLTLSPEGQLAHFEAQRWADRLPELLESLLRRSLAARGLAPSAGSLPSTGEACELRLELQEFFARLDRFGVARSVDIGWQGTLHCADRAYPTQVARSMPVNGNHMPALVAAWQSGLDNATESLVAQIKGSGDHLPRPR